MKTLLELIGNTSLIKSKVNKNIFYKCEFMNLTGSIKDRAALFMIKEALNDKKINQDTHIIEATSGNTGIALSLIANLFNLKLTIIMPESMSIERRKFIKAYGANLILTPAKDGMKGSIEKANELSKEKNTFLIDQFSNKSNILAHYKTTAPEIYNELNDIDIFIAGVGTGGTISGIGKYLKEKNKKIKIIAIEPKNSAVLSGNSVGIHKIQGIGAGFIPKNFDKNAVDEIVTVSDEEAFSEMKNLAKEGFFVGISSGANVAGAKKISKLYPNSKIVTILADRGERYLSII